MSKASLNNGAAKKVLRVDTSAPVETITPKNGKGHNKPSRADSIASVRILGENYGDGKTSWGRFAVHLCHMASLEVISSEGDDAKDHLKVFIEAAKLKSPDERSDGDNKTSQCRNFIKLGELETVNGEAVLSDAMLEMKRIRANATKNGPKAKQTWVGYLDVSKAQLKSPNQRLSTAKIAEMVKVNGKEEDTLATVWARAFKAMKAAADFDGSPAMAADLANKVKNVAKKFANANA